MTEWGLGASAVGRRFAYDLETCDSGHRVPRSQPPLYFELDRVLCPKCARARIPEAH